MEVALSSALQHQPELAMLRVTIRSVTIAAFAGALLAGCNEPSEQQLIASARTSLSRNDTKAAAIEAKRALALNNESGEARHLLGRALLQGGDPAVAEIELRKARARGAPDEDVVPEIARAMLLLGRAKAITDEFNAITLVDPRSQADLKTTLAGAYAQQGRGNLAEEAVAAAQQAAPGHAPSLLVRARMAASSGDIDGAARTLDEVLAREPANEAAGVAKGDLLWLAKADPAAALETYQKVIATAPQNVAARAAMAAILLRQGKVDKAREHGLVLWEAAPAHPETQFLWAMLYYVEKNYRVAREITDGLLRFVPNHTRALELAAACEFQMGNDGTAQVLADSALKLSPGLVLPRQILAQSLLRTGHASRAAEALLPLVDAADPDAWSLALAGSAYLQAGDARRADDAFKRAAKAAPAAGVRARTDVALAMLHGGRAEMAIDELAAAAERDPGTRADMALISARIAKGDMPGALTAIDVLRVKQPDAPLPHQLRGQVLIAMRDADGARKSFNAALAADAGYFPAAAALSAMDVATGKPEDGRRRLTAFLAANPNATEALLMLLQIPASPGAAPHDARGMLADAVRNQPRDVRLRKALVAHHLQFGDKATALVAAQEAAVALPNDRSVQETLARVQVAAGQAQQAVVTFKTLASQHAYDAQVHMQYAEALLAVKDRDGAETAFKRAMQADPAFMPARRGLALLALRDGRPQDALTMARDLQRKRPKEAIGFAIEGDIEAQRRNWPAAASAYQTALQKGETTEAAIRLYEVLRISGKKAEAERLAAQWETKHPNDAAFRFHLGDVALNQREFARAETHYRAVLASQPDNAPAMNNLAWLLMQQSKPGALAIAEKANALLPNRAPMMDTLASIQAAEGRLADAIATQRRAVAAAPEDPGLRLALGRYLVNAGQRDAAREQLEPLSRLGERFRGHAEVQTLLKSL